MVPPIGLFLGHILNNERTSSPFHMIYDIDRLQKRILFPKENKEFFWTTFCVGELVIPCYLQCLSSFMRFNISADNNRWWCSLNNNCNNKFLRTNAMSHFLPWPYLSLLMRLLTASRTLIDFKPSPTLLKNAGHWMTSGRSPIRLNPINKSSKYGWRRHQ